MVCKSKKIVGTCLLGVMTILGAGGVATAADNVKVVQAESTEVEIARGQIERTATSLRANYLGVKNVWQWQQYIALSRDYTSKIVPGSTRDTFNQRIDAQEQVVNAVIRLGQLETSMENNAHVVRNIPQWKDYVNMSMTEIKKINSDYKDLAYKLADRLINKIDIMVKILEDSNQTGSYNYEIYDLQKTQSLLRQI